MPKTDLRPLPANFLQVYDECQGVLSHLKAHFHTNDDVVYRWLRELGLEPKAYGNRRKASKLNAEPVRGDMHPLEANVIIRRATAALRGEL